MNTYIYSVIVDGTDVQRGSLGHVHVDVVHAGDQIAECGGQRRLKGQTGPYWRTVHESGGGEYIDDVYAYLTLPAAGLGSYHFRVGQHVALLEFTMSVVTTTLGFYSCFLSARVESLSEDKV